VAAAAARQHGVIAIGQLLDLGLSHSGVSRRVTGHRLHRIHRGVYAVGHKRLSREGRWMAAVLAAGDGAALSHLSAAVLWQIWRGRVDTTDVIALARPRAIRGFRVHRCRRLDRRDVTVVHDIPVTTVARTLVDLSDVLDAHQLANVIHEASFRRRFSAAATLQASARASGRRNLTVLDRALAAHAAGSAGTRSALEDSFLGLVRSSGLPEPLVNVTVQAGASGLEVDFHWPEIQLCVEIDGPGHDRPSTRREDARRDRALRAAGHAVVRFSGTDVQRRACWVLTTLGAAIQRQGLSSAAVTRVEARPQ